MVLDSSDFQRARDSQEALMIEKVDIERLHLESDGAGGFIQDFALAYRGIKARLTQPGLQARGESVFANSVREEADVMLSLPHNQTLDARDRVLHNGVKYEVLAVATANSYITAKRALLRRVVS